MALKWQSPLDPKTQLRKQTKMMYELIKKYNAEIAKRSGITQKELRDILVEGMKKNWPAPAALPPRK